MADNPIALVDNRCKAWLDSVGFKASGFHSGPEQGAIQGLPFGYEERPNVDANSIVNELVARIAEHWHKARGAKRDGIDIGSFVKSERMKSAPVIVNRLMCIIDVPAHAPAHVLPPRRFSWSVFRKPGAVGDAGLQVGGALIPLYA